MNSNQNIQWDKVKKEIISNVNRDFRPLYNQSLEDVVEMFVQIVLMPIDARELSGIPDGLSTSLQRFFVDSQDPVAHFKVIAHVESFLRKVLFLVKPKEYSEVKNMNDGLAKVLAHLELNPYDIRFDRGENELTSKQRQAYGVHLLRAYAIRNMQSHEFEKLGSAYLFGAAQSALIIYLYAVNKHCIALQARIPRADARRADYLARQVENFMNWNKRFVPINGREQFQEIAIYAVETSWDQQRKDAPREGEVEQLRLDLINAHQHQMIIQGEAGMGKTTTMKYLALRDAQAGKLPIYVELKLLTVGESLTDVIMQRLRQVSDNPESLMKSTDTCIFLDGLNEIDPSLRGNTLREILKLIERFPQVFFLISTRPQDYDGQLGNVPVFSLQKMDIAKIREFLRRNTDDQHVREIIAKAIDENENWLRILGTPLVLFMLIQVVSQEGCLPDDENKIILKFIFGLYNREKQKDYLFDQSYFHHIISMIAYECIDKVGSTNTGFSFLKAKELIGKSAGISDAQLMEILKKGVELLLLVEDGELFSFSHQTYQDALSGDYFNKLFV